MAKETKFGYGFLLAGAGLPYLIDKLLGPIAALTVAAVCTVCGFGFLLAGHLHRDKNEVRKQRGLMATIGMFALVGAASGALIGSLSGAIWNVAHSKSTPLTSIKTEPPSTGTPPISAMPPAAPSQLTPPSKVQDRNGETLAKGLIAPSTQDAEVFRRQKILERLRNEFILSHDGLSAALLAGTEQPPSDWINQRLKQLGEKWVVEKSPNEQPPLAIQKFIFTQELASSTRDDAPFAVKVVVQTTASVQPTALAIVCDSEVIDSQFRLGGGENPQRFGNGEVNHDKRIFWIFWGAPAFTPETPMTLTLMSKSSIHVLAVREGPPVPF